MAIMRTLPLFCALLSVAAGAYDKKVSSLACSGSYAPEYTVTYMNMWTADRHPHNFPANAHTSPTNLVSHNSDYTMYEIGTLASMGIQNVAETGNPAAIQAEFQMKQTEGSVLEYTLGPILWFNDLDPPSPPFPLSTESYSKTSVKVDAEHTQISWAHMLAPSPDWWTGFAGVDLCDEGKWVDELTLYTRAYDSGTDSGDTYLAADEATTPPENTFRITDGDLAYNGEVKAVAKFVIRRNKPVEPESYKLSKLSCMGTYSPEYEVTVTNYWRENRHPGNFPSANAHTSPGQLISHNGYYELFNTDSMASLGIKNVAETGNPDAIQAEFANYSDFILDHEQGPILWWTPRDDPGAGAPAHAVIGEVAELSIKVDKYNSLISYAHMLAPSPDWFTGLFGFDLCMHGKWADEIVVWTPPYDAGTDCGAHATSADDPCGPYDIHEITSDPDFLLGGGVLPVARFNIKRKAPASDQSVPFGGYEVSNKPCDMPTKFDVNMRVTWSSVNHPEMYPHNAHTSPGNLVSHGSDYSLFRKGYPASAGIQTVAETGAPTMIQEEFKANVLSGSVLDRQQGNLLWWNEGRPPHAVASREDELTVRVDYHHSKISWATMLAPSPDWFTGFYDVELCYDGYWIDKAILDAPPYDSGTDCGDTYMSEDTPCGPYDIFEITDSDHVLATVNSVATFEIKMTDAPDTCTPETCCLCTRNSCRKDPWSGNCRMPGRTCGLDCNEYCIDELYGYGFYSKEAPEKSAATLEATKETAASAEASKLDTIFNLSIVAVALMGVVLIALFGIAVQGRKQRTAFSAQQSPAACVSSVVVDGKHDQQA